MSAEEGSTTIQTFAQEFESGKRQKFTFSTHELRPQEKKNYTAKSLRYQYNNVYYPRSKKEQDQRVVSEKDSTVLQNISGIVSPFEYRKDQSLTFKDYTAEVHAQELEAFYRKAIVERYTKEAEDVKIRAMWATFATTGVVIIGCYVAFTVVPLTGGTAILVKIPTIISTFQGVNQAIQNVAVRKVPVWKALAMLGGKTAFAYLLASEYLPDVNIFSVFGGFASSHSWWENTSHVLKSGGMSMVRFFPHWALQTGGNLALGKFHNLLLSKTQLAQAVANETVHNMLYKNISLWRSIVYRKVHFQNPQLGREMTPSEMIEFGHKLAGNDYDVRYILSMDEKKNLSYSRQFFLQTQRIIGISSITSFLFHTIRSAHDVLEKETSLKLQYNSSTMIDYNISDFIKHRLIAVLGLGAYRLFRPLVQKVITENAILVNFMALHYLGKGFSKVVPDFVQKMFQTEDEQTILKRQFYKILPQKTMWKSIFEFVWWAMKDFSTNLARTHLNQAMEGATVMGENTAWDTLKEWGKRCDVNLLYYVHNIQSWEDLELYLQNQMGAVVNHVEKLKREAKMFEKFQSASFEQTKLEFYDRSFNEDLLPTQTMFDNPLEKVRVLKEIEQNIDKELQTERDYESAGGIQQFMKQFDKVKELENKIQELEREVVRMNDEAQMGRESWLMKSRILRKSATTPQGLRDYAEKYTHFAEQRELDEPLKKMEYIEQMSWFYEKLKFSHIVSGQDLDHADQQKYDSFRNEKLDMKKNMLDMYKRLHHMVVDKEKTVYERKTELAKTAQEELQKLREIHGFQFRYLFHNAANHAFFLRQSEGDKVPMVGTFQTQDASYDTTTIPRQQEFLNQFYHFVKNQCTGDLCKIPSDDMAHGLSDLLNSETRRFIPSPSNSPKYHNDRYLQELEAFRVASNYYSDRRDDRTVKDDVKVAQTNLRADGATGISNIKVNLLPKNITGNAKDHEIRQMTQINARRAVLAAIDGGHVKNESLTDKLVYRILYEPTLLELFGITNGDDVMLPIFELDEGGKLSQNTVDGVAQLHLMIAKKLNTINAQNELGTKFGQLEKDLGSTSWWGDAENTIFHLKDQSYKFMQIEEIFSDMVDSHQQYEQETKDGVKHNIPPSSVMEDFQNLDKEDVEGVVKFVHKYNHGIRSYLRSNFVEEKDQVVKVFLNPSSEQQDVEKLYALAENFYRQYSIVRTNLVIKNPAGMGTTLVKYLDGTIRGEVKSSTQIGYETMYRYQDTFKNNDNQYFTHDFDGSSQSAYTQANRLVLNEITKNEEITETVLHSKNMTEAAHQAASRLSMSDLTATVMNSVDGPEGVLNMEEKDFLNPQGNGMYSYLSMIASIVGDPATKDSMLIHINKKDASVSANSNIDLTSFLWMSANALHDQVPKESQEAPFEAIRNLITTHFHLETGLWEVPKTKQEFEQFVASIRVEPSRFQVVEQEIEKDKAGNTISMKENITVDPKVYRYLTIGAPDGMVAYFHDRHIKRTLSTSWLRYAVGMNEGVITRKDAEYYKNLPEYQTLKEQFPDLPDAHVMMRNAVLQGTDYERFTKIPESGKLWVEYDFSDTSQHTRSAVKDEIDETLMNMSESVLYGLNRAQYYKAVIAKRGAATSAAAFALKGSMFMTSGAIGSVSITNVATGMVMYTVPAYLGGAFIAGFATVDLATYALYGEGSYIVDTLYAVRHPILTSISHVPSEVLEFFGIEKNEGEDQEIAKWEFWETANVLKENFDQVFTTSDQQQR